ncbi:universal stress protein [Bacillus massiliglaciei]|uniref:universal stress protein n=1 Tax=Bacillus massiliglaciei TaxID=1816693 RepID=UPI000AC4753F|nr:universal stress protein [Bacillus massiliglaciei]
MFKKILLAFDGSDHSYRAAREAIKMASFTQESVIEVIYVADFEKSKSDVLHSQGDTEFTRRMKLQPVEELMKAEQVTYKVKIIHGEPGPSIVEYANKEKFDLAVIGSRGLNTLQEMVLGSVSHKVAKRVTCPVLIVK